MSQCGAGLSLKNPRDLSPHIKDLPEGTQENKSRLVCQSRCLCQQRITCPGQMMPAGCGSSLSVPHVIQQQQQQRFCTKRKVTQIITRGGGGWGESESRHYQATVTGCTYSPALAWPKNNPAIDRHSFTALTIELIRFISHRLIKPHSSAAIRRHICKSRRVFFFLYFHRQQSLSLSEFIKGRSDSAAPEERFL